MTITKADPSPPPHVPVGRIAVATAAGLGALIGAGTAAWAGLQKQADLAALAIGDASTPPPRQDGSYLPDGTFAGEADVDQLVLVMLGDSTSAGFGAADVDGVPGVQLARALAAELGRPVKLSTHAVVGSRSADLPRQVAEALSEADGGRIDLAVIVVGANDVRDRVSPQFATRMLVEAIGMLQAAGVSVVVGSCPDLGVIQPIPQPLRQLAGSWSRRLAARQERLARRAGARPVSIARRVSPEFRTHADYFSPDLFHPSGLGYGRAVAELLPAAVEAVRERMLPTPLSARGRKLFGKR